MDRVCPAKTQALQMGKAWFAAHEQNEWCTNDQTAYKEATPFVDAFVLFKGRKMGQSCSPQWWGTSQCCSGSCRWIWRGWWGGHWKCAA